MRKCKYCGSDIEESYKKLSNEYCNVHYKKVIYNHQKLFPDGSEFVECKICGLRGKQLVQHVRKVHKLTVDDYCKQFNLTKYDLLTESQHKLISANSTKAALQGLSGWQKGKANPSQRPEVKSGRKSIFSKNYYGYDGLTDEEKEKRIHEAAQRNVDKMNANHNNPLRKDFYKDLLRKGNHLQWLPASNARQTKSDK